ncbi:hypothetical protein EON66_03695 [archaeon]|nr:MAG: hypothetical protein EON66_03695 [archaeon]
MFDVKEAIYGATNIPVGTCHPLRVQARMPHGGVGRWMHPRTRARARTRHTRAHAPADFPTSAGSIVLMAASGTLHAPLTDSHVLHDTESALQMAVHMDGGCGGGVGCRLPCGGCHCGGRCTIQ